MFKLILLFLLVGCATKPQNPIQNDYTQVNLVANRAEYKPLILDERMQNAWGLANRPAGFGGHFWVTAQKTGTSIEYVGDIGSTALYQDELKYVDLFTRQKKLDTPTGVVFNPAKKFVIDQTSPKGNFSSESKFIFVTDSGRIYGWAEKKNTDGTFNRPTVGVIAVDQSKRGDQYFGVGVNSRGDELYVADFGKYPQIRVFDAQFNEKKLKADQFKNPFIKGAFSRKNDYAPFNVQVIQIDHQDRIFVAYAKFSTAGEEIKGVGLGRVVEFDENGQLIRIWNDRGLLDAPWGFVMAPITGFGPFSGKLLVSNFGDGTIVAFDPKTFEALDYMKSAGEKIKIEGLWGLMFGNGASLGEADHLYFAAGPKDENDGLFGKLKLNLKKKE